MPSTPYLLRRGRWYHFRVRVPADLIPYFERRYIVSSLHTCNYRLAASQAKETGVFVFHFKNSATLTTHFNHAITHTTVTPTQIVVFSTGVSHGDDREPVCRRQQSLRGVSARAPIGTHNSHAEYQELPRLTMDTVPR